ncbi:unnamed protein product [Ambrosiozyma monospora]|uniref:Unnamed protein product n=1 Tax=Ambrosiozyma monospora TaxID=43982 RepID=A0ACB5T807_AMBMO|nr:unnamed protein product [Ambrosiozyma monospora]
MSDIQPSSKFKGPKFKIDTYPPHHSAFCRKYPIVAGQFSFDLIALEGSKASLKSIEIGLKGHVRIGDTDEYCTRDKKVFEKFTENFILFDQSSVVYDGLTSVENCDDNGIVQSEFHFEFPSDKKLQSTVAYKGSNPHRRATVMYYLYSKLSLFVD